MLYSLECQRNAEEKLLSLNTRVLRISLCQSTFPVASFAFCFNEQIDAAMTRGDPWPPHQQQHPVSTISVSNTQVAAPGGNSAAQRTGASFEKANASGVPSNVPDDATSSFSGVNVGGSSTSGAQVLEKRKGEDDDEDESALFEALLARIGYQVVAFNPAAGADASGAASAVSTPLPTAPSSTTQREAKAGDASSLGLSLKLSQPRIVHGDDEEVSDSDDDDDDALLAAALGSTGISQTPGAKVYQPFLVLPPATSPVRSGRQSPQQQQQRGGDKNTSSTERNTTEKRRKGKAALSSTTAEKLAAELPLPKMVHYHLDETGARDSSKR